MATNRIISAKDHASVQISIPHVDKDGHLNGHSSTVALCGYVRSQGKADQALNKILQDEGFTTAFPEYQTAK